MRSDIKGDDDANNDETYLGWVSYWIVVHGAANRFGRFKSFAEYMNERAPPRNDD